MVPEVGSTEVEKPERARTLADWELVPRVITLEDEELFDSCTVSPRAPTYLRELVIYGNSIYACAEMGINPATPRSWKRRCSHFAEILETLRIEIVERWNALAQDRALTGFEERMYDKHNNLIGKRVRQSDSFLRAMMGAQDPENWGREGASGTSINIVIQDVRE